MAANHNQPHDYALHDAITGKDNEVARRKRWWMRRLMGPDRQRYSRLLFGLDGDDA